MTEEIKNAREKEIKEWLTGKEISQVRYYLMNRPGYLHPNAPLQLVDAAVEIATNEGSKITFGWNFDYVILDMYAQEFESRLKSYNDSLPYVGVSVEADEQWKDRFGHTITDVHITWNWFTDLDENTHYIPQDIELKLSNGKYLAICTTAYSVDEEGIHIQYPDSEGELLVLFDEEDTKYFKRGKYYDPKAFLDEGEDEASFNEMMEGS